MRFSAMIERPGLIITITYFRIYSVGALISQKPEELASSSQKIIQVTLMLGVRDETG